MLKSGICKRPDCLAELTRFSSEIGGAEIQFVRERQANLNDPSDPANANTPAKQKNATASNAQATSKTQTEPTDSGRNEPAAIITGCLNGTQQYPSLFQDKTGKPYLFDANNLKTNAFYPYYFLNKLQSHSLYLDDGCCVTYAKDKTVILLYNNGQAGQKERKGKNEPAKESVCSEEQKPGDTSIRKYMFNLKHITKPLIYQCLTLDENYESEAEISASLSLNSLTLDPSAPSAPDKAASHEIRRRIQIKAYPDTKIASIAASPEYNLFLSVPPHTVTLIELE